MPLSFLSNYANLREITIDGCDGITDISSLHELKNDIGMIGYIFIRNCSGISEDDIYEMEDVLADSYEIHYEP